MRASILNLRNRRCYLVEILTVLAAGTLQAKDFEVGPKARYATITAALPAVRALPAGEPRRILVRGGTYYDTQVQLTAEDSGLTIENAPGETPVFYGGGLVSGWETEGKFQAAPLAVSSNGLAPRWLLVNGESRPRARYPATNALPHETRFEVPWMSSTGGGWKRRPTQEELTTLQYSAGGVGDWLEVSNAEITVFHMWDESCVGIAAHDPGARVLTLAPAPGHPPGAFGVRKFVLWNLKEGMTAPGQWYHDRLRQRLVYWPLPGEDLRRATVVAPSRAYVFSLRGTRERPVRNVTLRGLTVAGTTVPLVSGGFAAAAFDGAISLAQAEDCLLDRLVIRGVAGQGINDKGGLRRVRVEHCEISDCGAGGIYVGGARAVIRDNHVWKVGRSYPSAVGIFRGGSGCTVSHNEVHDCTYSAINYGGRSNVIEGNLLYDCMKVLHDGAAIYVFGGQGTVLRGNLARDFTDFGGYGASAYYLDEQCSNCVVEGNVALRVNWPSHNHMATNNWIRDNVFIVDGDAKLTFPRSTGYTFAGNVIHATGKIRFEGTNAVSTWTNNLLFSGRGRIECVALNQYSSAGTATNPPPNSVVADPLFVDLARGDYRYRAGSPALRLGLKPVEVSTAGRRKR